MDKEDRKKLAAEMVKYAGQTDQAVTTIGRLAGNGGDFFKRLQDERVRIWPETLQKQRDFMAANPPKKEGTAA